MVLIDRIDFGYDFYYFQLFRDSILHHCDSVTAFRERRYGGQQPHQRQSPPAK